MGKPYGQTLNQKTIDCLRLCALPIESDERRALMDVLDKKYSWKAVVNTIENRSHLFEYGVSANWAWLTKRGKSALAEANDPNFTPVK